MSKHFNIDVSFSLQVLLQQATIPILWSIVFYLYREQEVSQTKNNNN